MANETRENEDGTRFYVCEGGELGRTESRGSKYLSSGVQNSDVGLAFFHQEGTP